jgi:hypothetical protein
LTVDLTLSHTMPNDGVIIMKLPKWNPESSSTQPIFTTSDIGCSTTTGFLTVNTIICTFSANVDSSTTPDQLRITGDIDPTATNLVFRIDDVRNSPSLTSYSGISFTTSSSVTTDEIDQVSGVSFPLTTAATLDPSFVTLTATDTKVNVDTTYTFSIRISLPMPAGSSITLTFPTTVTPTSTAPTVTGISNLNSGITSVYATATKVLTMTDIVSAGNYVEENFSISFNITSVTNSNTTNTSGDIIYASFDASGGAIETVLTGINITASAGYITPATVTPTDATIRASTTYEFTFQTENIIPSGAIIYIAFPSTITISDRSGTSCLTDATNIDAVNGVCTVTSTRFLTISNAYTTQVLAGNLVNFTISGVTNYITSLTSDTFEIETRTSAGFVIDKYQAGVLTVTATAQTITGFTVASTTTTTGVAETYTFDFDFTTITVLTSSYIQIVFPSEITISDTEYSANTCQTTGLVPSDISCTFATPQILESVGQFNGSSFSFTVDDVTNPRTTEVTSSFQMFVLDSNGDFQYSATTGYTLTMTDASDFQSISLSSASQNNGATTNYTFSMTLSNALIAGEFIQVIFPAEVIPTANS